MVSADQRARPADRYARLGRALAERGRNAAGEGTVGADQDRLLVTRAVAGSVAAWRRGVRVPVGDTLAGAALREGGPLAAGLRRPRYRHEQALAAAGLRRVLYLPIPGFGSMTGVLGLGYRRGGGISGREDEAR